YRRQGQALPDGHPQAERSGRLRAASRHRHAPEQAHRRNRPGAADRGRAPRRKAEGRKPQMTPIRIAFLPLTDCAILAAAKERGFAEKHGIALELVRDVSWATIRDRLVYRGVEC